MRGTGAPRPRFSGWEDVSYPLRFRIFACRRPKIGRQPKRIICSRRKSRLEILQRLLSISRLQSLGWKEKTYKSSKVLAVEDISIDLTHRMCCRSTRQRARGGIARGGSLTSVLCGALHLLRCILFTERWSEFFFSSSQLSEWLVCVRVSNDEKVFFHSFSIHLSRTVVEEVGICR